MVITLAAACACGRNPDSNLQPAELVRMAQEKSVFVFTVVGEPKEIVAQRIDTHGPEDGAFETAVDVAASPSGAYIAVLDRTEQRVLLFDTLWNEIGRFGRKGEGPKEFKDPVAIEALPNALLIWDRALRRFTVADSRGSIISTAPQMVIGDSYHVIYREPMWGIYSPFSGNVDLARRFRRADHSTFMQEVEDNEWADTTAGHGRRTYLLRYSRDLRSVDTVAVAPAAQVNVRTAQSRLGAGRYYQNAPLFTSKLEWSSDSGVVAVVMPKSKSVDIYRDHAKVASIETRFERVAVDNTAKEAFLRWSFVRWLPYWPEESRKRNQRTGAMREYITNNLSIAEFAEASGPISNVFVNGNHVWIGGFHPNDNPDGSSLSWLVLDVVHWSVVGRIRVGDPGLTLRDIANCVAYMTGPDAEGLYRIYRYRLPQGYC